MDKETFLEKVGRMKHIGVWKNPDDLSREELIARMLRWVDKLYHGEHWRVYELLDLEEQNYEAHLQYENTPPLLKEQSLQDWHTVETQTKEQAIELFYRYDSQGKVKRSRRNYE